MLVVLILLESKFVRTDFMYSLVCKDLYIRYKPKKVDQVPNYYRVQVIPLDLNI